MPRVIQKDMISDYKWAAASFDLIRAFFSRIRAMSSNQKSELISHTIQKLIDEDKRDKVPSATTVGLVGDGDDQILVSKLISQLELVKEDGDVNPSEPEVTSPAEIKAKVGNENSGEGECSTGSKEISTEEIVKELRTVKRQNTITHVLLSVMIALTVTWQLSEVSLILKIKDGIRNPFRLFGDAVAGMLKHPAITNGLDAEKHSTSDHENHNEDSSFSTLKMPELPHVDLPGLGFVSDRD